MLLHLLALLQLGRYLLFELSGCMLLLLELVYYHLLLQLLLLDDGFADTS